MSITDQASVENRLKSLGVDEGRSKLYAAAFFDAYGNVQNTYGKSLDESINSLASRLVGGGSQVGGGLSPATSVQTVNVVVGGKTIPVQVANRAQVNNLVAALQEAAAAAGN